MSATGEVRQQQGKRMPPWMSMPGAPPRPDFAIFGRKMSQLSEEKRRLFDEVKTLQASLRGDETRDVIDSERKELRERMNTIDAQRKAEKDLRGSKNEEIAKIRKQRREITDKLRILQTELGGFDDLKDIDAAIDYVIKKMETSGGGLSAEKRTVRRLHQLEEAKSLLLELQPLSEAIQETSEREVVLQQEYREIHERIGVLNKEYEEGFKTKQAKDKEALKTGADRSSVYKQCDEIRAKITKINEQMNQMRDTQNKISSEWDAWCTEARAKYAAKVEAEQAERHRQYLERKNASKIAEKLTRARERQNPHEVEIHACDTLVLYLNNKKHMLQREEEEHRKRDAAATFNPNAAAPSGFVVLNESQWNNSKPLSKAAKKQQQKQKSSSSTARMEGANAATAKPRVMQHPEEMMRMMMMIKVDPPLAADQIDGKIKEIKERQQEFKSHITTGDLIMSSSDEDVSDMEENTSSRREDECDERRASVNSSANEINKVKGGDEDVEGASKD